MNIPDFEQKQRYFRAFWEQDVIDRPLISVMAPKGPRQPVAYLEGADTGNYLPVLKKVAANFENTWFGGEALPCYECSFGPDQFAAHIALSVAFSIVIFFAHPYHSWERGLNEHTKGLIRQ